MKVTQVAITPTQSSQQAGRPALTPELLAACGARYSRNDEGLEAILAKIDPANLDASVDGIFRMIDYGHQSIADMVPVAMFIDGISLWLAYYVWTLCPTAGGQESSTRYIKLDQTDLLQPAALGIAEDDRIAWQSNLDDCLRAYEGALDLWQSIAAEHESVTRIPAELRNAGTDRAARQVARMQRNYAFDRARYFLPAAMATNMMLLMPARGWVTLCQHLLSHPLPEAVTLGESIRGELELCAPRMLRHAVAKPSMAGGLEQSFSRLQAEAVANPPRSLYEEAAEASAAPAPSLQVLLPPGVGGASLAEDLKLHDNRYAWMGDSLKRTSVTFGWDAVAFAEIRDLNRHRTGHRYCPMHPVGFYAAEDQLAGLPSETALPARQMADLKEAGRAASLRAHSALAHGDMAYIYFTTLGTQYPFHHTTTADKFIYEAELRTGTGAHYRYSRHLHDVLDLWFTRFPETRGLVLEGTAEPE